MRSLIAIILLLSGLNAIAKVETSSSSRGQKNSAPIILSDNCMATCLGNHGSVADCIQKCGFTINKGLLGKLEADFKECKYAQLREVNICGKLLVKGLKEAQQQEARGATQLSLSTQNADSHVERAAGGRP